MLVLGSSSQQPGAPIACRPDWRPAQGKPGTDRGRVGRAAGGGEGEHGVRGHAPVGGAGHRAGKGPAVGGDLAGEPVEGRCGLGGGAGHVLRGDRPGGGRVTRVLLVDDHAMVRQGLRSVLNAYDDIQIVGEAQDGLEAVRLVGELRPRVVIMDISMPKLNGIEATAQIKTRYPDTTVIGLSVNADGENAEAMARAGATRLMTKEAAVESLYGAIRKAVEAIEPPLERLFTA